MVNYNGQSVEKVPSCESNNSFLVLKLCNWHTLTLYVWHTAATVDTTYLKTVIAGKLEWMIPVHGGTGHALLTINCQTTIKSRWNWVTSLCCVLYSKYDDGYTGVSSHICIYERNTIICWNTGKPLFNPYIEFILEQKLINLHFIQYFDSLIPVTGLWRLIYWWKIKLGWFKVIPNSSFYLNL